MNEAITWVLDIVEAVDPLVRILVAGVAILLETSILVGLVVPGDTIVIVAGTAASSWPEGIGLGTAVVAGSLAGESIGFALGRFLGARIRTSRIGKRIGETNWVRAERYLEKRGGPAIFLSRFLPVLHSLVPLTVGASGFPYRRFLAWTLPACIAWAGLYISVASLAAGTFRELSDTIHYAGYLFIGALFVFILLIVIVKKTIQRTERHHLIDDAARDSHDEHESQRSR